MNKQKVLGLLGLAMKAKKLVTGEEFVLEKIRDKTAKLVFLASDVGPNTKKRIHDKASFYEIEIIDDFTSEELSQAIGKINRKTIALLDSGFARSINALK